MKFQEFIGIDVSKSYIDVFIFGAGYHAKFDNQESGFHSMIDWMQQNIACALNQVLIAFEHTGLYSLPLSLFLSDNNYNLSIIPGLEIKRSLGIARGKNDKYDARTIAEYAYEKSHKIKLYQMPDRILFQLKRLLSYRDSLVKERTAFLSRDKELKGLLDNQEHSVMFESQARMIKYLDQEIQTIEDQLFNLIKEDEILYKQYNLINSIKGVGPQTALMMIVLTNGFTQFEKWRQFASYAGIAPFPYESGKFKGRTKTNHLANKKIKALLGCCANSAIRYNPEMALYYQRRVDEGKNEMSTINIVRNKLLARIFAVVHRETPYVETCKFAA
mgnify:CR=1 FL=1